MLWILKILILCKVVAVLEKSVDLFEHGRGIKVGFISFCNWVLKGTQFGTVLMANVLLNLSIKSLNACV